MKIKLPNGEKIKLDDNISLEEKKIVVKQLEDEWRDIVKANRVIWFSSAVKSFFDSLANYILWHKEDDEKGTEDKDILSITKINQMTGRRESKVVNAGNLSKIGEFIEDDEKRREVRREIREEVKKSENEVSEVIVYYEK
jgi:hypothetical protein